MAACLEINGCRYVGLQAAAAGTFSSQRAHISAAAVQVGSAGLDRAAVLPTKRWIADRLYGQTYGVRVAVSSGILSGAHGARRTSSRDAQRSPSIAFADDDGNVLIQAPAQSTVWVNQATTWPLGRRSTRCSGSIISTPLSPARTS